MNEVPISSNSGLPVRSDEQGINGPGSEQRPDLRFYFFAQQRIGEYKAGGVSSNLMARDYKSASDLVIEEQKRKYIVRRLTPLECCRLQGFPDFWEDGVNGSDSARYKLWGNGIALPCAYDLLNKITNELRKED